VSECEVQSITVCPVLTGDVTALLLFVEEDLPAQST